MIARSSPGAILEDDATLTLPPVVLPHAIVGTPLDLGGTVSATSIISQSFVFARAANFNGILAASSFTLPRFSKGGWHINLSVSYVFSGTVSTDAIDGVGITESTGVTEVTKVWAIIRAASPLQNSSSHELWLILPDDGTRLVITTSATVAADNMGIIAAIVANKLW